MILHDVWDTHRFGSYILVVETYTTKERTIVRNYIIPDKKSFSKSIQLDDYDNNHNVTSTFQFNVSFTLKEQRKYISQFLKIEEIL